VEQDPLQILDTVVACINQTCTKLEKLHVDPNDIKAIGGHIINIMLNSGDTGTGAGICGGLHQVRETAQ
jgi:hypothetical protein